MNVVPFVENSREWAWDNPSCRCGEDMIRGYDKRYTGVTHGDCSHLWEYKFSDGDGVEMCLNVSTGICPAMAFQTWQIISTYIYIYHISTTNAWNDANHHNHKVDTMVWHHRGLRLDFPCLYTDLRGLGRLGSAGGRATGKLGRLGPGDPVTGANHFKKCGSRTRFSWNPQKTVY